MALGGGGFQSYSKVLPGAYMNFVSAGRSSASVSDRGCAALGLVLSWGQSGEVFKVSREEFYTSSLKLFGYRAEDASMAGMRDLFRSSSEAYFYRLNGGTAASCSFGSARYGGVRGNSIRLVIEKAEGTYFRVTTYFDSEEVDTQLVSSASELEDNDFILFNTSSVLAPSAGIPFTGGTDGALVSVSDYRKFLSKLESYSFSCLGCLSDEEEVKAEFTAFTKRMRDEYGVKFQCVLHRYEKADYEGIISLENNEGTELIWWVLGALAGCALNESLTNRIYDGEAEVDVSFSISQLEAASKAGKFILHRSGGDIRVLQDINTLTTFTASKGADFRLNQTVRVIDQIGGDIARLFSEKYLGVIPNDAAGRISLWSDIVAHHSELERLRCIENFEPSSVTVSPGRDKTSVIISDCVLPVSAMSVLYMTVVIE